MPKPLSKNQERFITTADYTMRFVFIAATLCLTWIEIHDKLGYTLSDKDEEILTTFADYPWNYTDLLDGFIAFINIINRDKTDQWFTYTRLLSFTQMLIATSLHAADQDDTVKAVASATSFGIAMMVSALPFLKDLAERSISACRAAPAAPAGAQPLLQKEIKKAGPSLGESLFNSLWWVSSAGGAFLGAAGIAVAEQQPKLQKTLGRLSLGCYAVGTLCRVVSLFPCMKKEPLVQEDPELSDEDNADFEAVPEREKERSVGLRGSANGAPAPK